MARRICDLQPDIIIFDEIHRIGAEHWEPEVDKLCNCFPDAQIIGMSATPERTNKRNMALEKFDIIVYEMNLMEALSGEKENEVVLKGSRYVKSLSILRANLSSYEEQIETIEDKDEKIEFREKYEKLSALVQKLPGLPEIMEEGMQKRNGKYYVFCANRDDMFEKMQMAPKIFGRVNSKIKIDYVISKYKGVGKTKAQNRKTLEEFERREENDSLNLLFCVDMLIEGVHMNGIDGEVLLRKINSSIVYQQLIGRVQSSDPKAKKTVIIDPFNNWLRQMDTFQKMLYSMEEGSKRSALTTKRKRKLYELLELKPEELEILDIIKEFQEREERVNQEIYEQYVNWLETHNGKEPKSIFKKGKRRLTIQELTPEQKRERKLSKRWKLTPIYKALYKCMGIPLDEIPEEYEKFKEQIFILRSYGLGVTVYEEMIHWLKTHDGKGPRGKIVQNRRQLKAKELSPEQKKELNLKYRWKRTPEFKALQACKGIPIEEIPEEYKKFKEKIIVLRSYGQGIKKKPLYEEVIEWLETHDGKQPRNTFYQGKKIILSKKLTIEQRKERALSYRWKHSKLFKILYQCRRNTNRRFTSRI